MLQDLAKTIANAKKGTALERHQSARPRAPRLPAILARKTAYQVKTIKNWRAFD